MGLGIHVGAEIPRKGILKRCMPDQDLFNLIEGISIQFLKKSTLDHSCSSRDDEVLYLSFHPSEEDVYFYATDDNHIVCSAKTSCAGPGYHALLIELLDYIDQNSDISWIWESEEPQYQDETGYYFHRDFQKLQIAMGEQLHAIAAQLIADQELSQLRLSLPLDLALHHTRFAASPMGFWNRDFFEKVSGKQPSDPDSFKLAEQFYPWWHREIDGLFWKNLALTQMWTNISWHPPIDEESYEWEAIRLAINSAVKAQNLDPDISLPKDELEELEALLKHDPEVDDLPIPASNKIGFRRHLLRKHLTGSWSLLVPGYFYETLENDGSTVILFYRDLTIHGSSLSFEGKEGSPIDDFDDPEVVAILDSDGLRGRAIVKKSEDPENDGWILDCLVSAGNSLCILTIYFENEKDKDWAISTFQTIQFETQQ